MNKIWQENEDGSVTFSTPEGRIYEFDFNKTTEFKLERRGTASLRSERLLIRMMLDTGDVTYIKCGKDQELADRILTILRDDTEAIET